MHWVHMHWVQMHWIPYIRAHVHQHSDPMDPCASTLALRAAPCCACVRIVALRVSTGGAVLALHFRVVGAHGGEALGCDVVLGGPRGVVVRAYPLRWQVESVGHTVYIYMQIVRVSSQKLIVFYMVFLFYTWLYCIFLDDEDPHYPIYGQTKPHGIYIQMMVQFDIPTPGDLQWRGLQVFRCLHSPKHRISCATTQGIQVVSVPDFSDPDSENWRHHFY